MFEKSFLQDVRHNLWGFDQDEVVVANYGSQIQEKYTANWGVQIAKWFLKYISELFSYYFVIFSIMRCSVLSLYNLFVLIRIV